MKGITPEDLADLKEPVDYVSLCKLAIDYSDGIIIQSEKVNKELADYVRKTGKPVLEPQTEENFADACNEFYDVVYGFQEAK